MNENKETNIVRDTQLNIGLENRMEDDRRSESSEGFTYISSVGWIDRREKRRRKDDPLDF